MPVRDQNLLERLSIRAVAIIACCLFASTGAYADEPVLSPLSKAQELVNLGNALASKERYEEAMSVYKKALELEPQNSKALFNIGKICMKWKYEYGQAKDYFEQALKSKPKFMEAWNMHGLCCKKMGNINGAEASFKQALSINPNYYDALCNLGFFYYTTDRFTEAREILNRAKVLPQSRRDQELSEFLEKLDQKLGPESK